MEANELNSLKSYIKKCVCFQSGLRLVILWESTLFPQVLQFLSERVVNSVNFNLLRSAEVNGEQT